MLSKRLHLFIWYCSKSLYEHCGREIQKKRWKRTSEWEQGKEWKKYCKLNAARRCVCVCVSVFSCFSSFRRTMNYKRNYISSKVREFGFYEHILWLFFPPFFYCAKSARSNARSYSERNSYHRSGWQPRIEFLSWQHDQRVNGWIFFHHSMNVYAHVINTLRIYEWNTFTIDVDNRIVWPLSFTLSVSFSPPPPFSQPTKTLTIEIKEKNKKEKHFCMKIAPERYAFESTVKTSK